MKHFLYLHLRDSNPSSSGHLLGNTRQRPGLVLLPKGKSIPGRRVLWRLNDDGTLELGGCPGALLHADATGGLHLRKTPAGAATWKVDGAGVLRHAASNKVVALDRRVDGRAVLAEGDEESQAQAYVQALGQDVLDILELPAAGYTQYTGTQGAAYSWIISKLPMLIGGDLRAEYTRTDFEPNTILTLLTQLTCPTTGVGFTASDFSTVQTGLVSELTYASAVVTNMGQTVQFWQQVFGDDSGYLSSLEADLTAASKSPPSVGLVIATLFENILYTAFSVFGAEGGFIANVMATAFNTAVAYISSNGGNEPVTFPQLQDRLRINLDQVLTQLATQKDAILANGNRAQALATFVHQNAPTNTELNNAKLTAEFVYLQQVLQQVLPGLCTWYGHYFTSSNPTPPSSVPSYNACTYSNTEGTFLFWLQMQSGQAVPQIVSTLMCTGGWIQASGANPNAMFLGLEGWGWPSAHSNDYDANDLILSLANETSSTLEVEAKPKHDEGKVTHPKPPKGHDTTKVTVEPGGLAIIVSTYERGLVTRIDVKPVSSAADDSDVIAHFHCHQHVDLAGGTPWISEKKVADGYDLPDPLCIHRKKALQPQPGMIFASLSATSA